MFFRKLWEFFTKPWRLFTKPWTLDYEGTIAEAHGAILVVGIDDHKQGCCDSVKEVLANWGCNWDVIGLDFPSYFYLKNGLVNVYGVIQLQTIKGMVGVPPELKLNQEMRDNITMMCKSKDVPLLCLGDTCNPENIKYWVESIISHQLMVAN